ncbi:MAG: carboxylating nicotinate-nucleotide diphosphorylase [Acidobacteria bacterium]|jgi:nicotinate-nucleotide pyrophosphorylase (carboxylating)|nr:MAG: carboxylating nicotinate-nucleotide diphosphorylase [Acidobacteriota bacterium]
MFKDLLLRFLEEDIGRGDITTEGVFRGERLRAVLRAKERGILAGGGFAEEVFKLLGDVKVLYRREEGQPFSEGEELLILEGSGDSILIGERTALNLLQRLSGIATLTRKFVKALEGTKIRLLDTRKTTPGMRYLEKYAVRVGGGLNHRFALYDMVLIKDNHKLLAGGIREAVRRVRERISPVYRIEVEVENLEELEEALSCGIDMVLLDNFNPDDVREAVRLSRGKALVEVSGNINLENIRDYAIDGVDFISSGSITHSARWLDMSMRVTTL